MNKILSITEELPQPTTLPDGTYIGSWGGYVININYEGKKYKLTTEEGVRGMNISVIVTINGDNMTFVESSN